MHFGPILDDRLKEKILKPWKGALSSHYVCVSVCKQVTGHTIWPKKLILGLNDPWDMRKKRIFGPILDDRLKEKLLKPWKGALCSHFRVCLSVRGLQVTPFDLGT